MACTGAPARLSADFSEKKIAEQNAKDNVVRGLTGHPDNQEY